MVLTVLLMVMFLLASCADEPFKHGHGNKLQKQQHRSSADIQKVHIIYMNHLDVGFAGLVNEILNAYFQTYFPRAIEVWKGLHDGGYVETFIYTTHPWLVALYLDCPPNLVLSGVKLQCPNDTQKAAFIEAVHKGCITWHAGPMNVQVEMAHDPWLFEFGIDIGKQLDKWFNITRKTLVMSHRDIPGLTHAAIPSLVKKGVSGVTVGVNNMSPPPAVPQNLFIWQFGTDSVLATWHPGGYPNNPGPDPAHPGGLSVDDCVIVDGLTEALCFAFRTDNSGPPENVEEVLQYYEILRAEFPNADLKASRLEEFFDVAQSVRDRLPVVNSEIGDTWIEGVASDPRRCAEYRAVSRVMRDCFSTGMCLFSDVRVWNSSLFLMKVPEHTWGIDTDSDTINWENDKFHKIQFTKPSFLRARDSWNEQRKFVYLAIEALQDHPVVQRIRDEFSHLVAKVPDLHDFVVVADPYQNFSCNGDSIQLHFGLDGSVVHFQYHGIVVASESYPFGRFIYTTYNESDITAFGRMYNYRGISAGYDKPNLTKNANAESRRWDVKLVSLYKSKEVSCEFYVKVQMVDLEAHTYYGAPESVWIHYVIQPHGVSLDVQMFNKTATRLPEAIFFSFNVQPLQKAAQWQMSKLGRPIDPQNVLLNGSQHHHVVDDNGVQYSGIRISSPDVAVVSPITDQQNISAYPAPLWPITEQINGFAFNLFNNVWEVNWIFWYPFNIEDANLKARFMIDFSQAGCTDGETCKIYRL